MLRKGWVWYIEGVVLLGTAVDGSWKGEADW